MTPARRILVTGATGALGSAICHALVAQGRSVVAVGRDEKKLKALVGTKGLKADLSSSRFDAESLIKRAEKLAGGAIDGVIQCAGILERQPSSEVNAKAFLRQMQVNTWAPIQLGIAAAQAMKNHRTEGSVVNIASVLALRPAPHMLAYSASKAALVSATQTLALEWASLGIRFNAFAPGLFESAMTSGRKLAKLQPIGRVGKPEEFVSPILALLDQPFAVGSVVVADGGWLVSSSG